MTCKKKKRTSLPSGVQIEDDDAATWVYARALREPVENKTTGWEPRLVVVIQATKEFLPS